MKDGPVPRAALLGTSRFALFVVVIPLILTFYFLHQHYAFIKSLNRPRIGIMSHSGTDQNTRARPRSSRERALSIMSDIFGRPLLDGCDFGAPEARDASRESQKRVRALLTRNDFGGFLKHDLGLDKGLAALVGVGGGSFADTFLQTYDGNLTFLVDPFMHQSGFEDPSNVKQDEQEALLSETISRLHTQIGRYKLIRESSSAAAPAFSDCSLSFVYIDARRDYAGALADLIDYWPKVRWGGVIAGHDYLDGILPEGNFAVKSAVDRFAAAVNRVVYATAGWPLTEDSTQEWSSFYIVK